MRFFQCGDFHPFYYCITQYTNNIPSLIPVATTYTNVKNAEKIYHIILLQKQKTTYSQKQSFGENFVSRNTTLQS